MALKHDHILNPVTALGFYVTESGDSIVLAGEGCFLKIFDTSTNRLLSSCRIFDGQTIHGIAIRDDIKDGPALRVAIWGGSSLILLEKEDVEGLLLQNASRITSSITAASDWIMDVAISPYDVRCVLITAHNTVLQARRTQGKKGAQIETLSSPSRSILYSADLVWESDSRILVAAGTVFGEIIVWNCNTTGESQVIYTFSGHEGSIFGVDISSPVVLPNGSTGRLLASCSDDRTIRVWDLATSVASISGSRNVIRDTGFGENDDPKTSEVASRCIAMVMGHASRIWSVKFLVEESQLQTTSSISVLSFGEDATAQHWSVDFESNVVHTTNKSALAATAQKNLFKPGAVAKLTQWSTFAFHSGKHIWSTAILRLAKSSYMLITGGADGKISKYALGTGEALVPTQVKSASGNTSLVSAIPTYEPSQSFSWFLEGIVSSLGPSSSAQKVVSKEPEPMSTAPDSILPDTDLVKRKASEAKKPVKDGFNKYAFTSESQVIATTNFGRVLVGDIDADVVWSEALLPETSRHDLRNYTVLEGLSDFGIAFLAGSNGTIFSYQNGRPIQVAGKVESKVTDMFKIFNNTTLTYDLLVTTLSSRVATLFVVQNSATASPQLSNYTSCNLPEKFMVTSAGRVDGLLVIGARSGLLATYETGQNADPINIWTPPKDFPSDAIATILPLTTPTFSTEDIRHFLTTERTGCYSIFSCTTTSDSDVSPRAVRLRRVHHRKLPFGPMIEAAWFQDGDLFFYGFKSKSLVVWNESKHYEVSSVDCGGAHRSYAYSPATCSSGGYFIYTKASKLHLHSQRNPSHTILKQGGHGRELKASAASSDGKFIATGAEDTAIRIWRYKDAAPGIESQLHCLSIVEKHTTGIQHLQWHGSKYLFSSGGNEEFFVWAIRFIPYFGIGVVCEASYPDRSADGDLRIMSFDMIPLASQHEDIDRLLISLAFSDSTIRTYAYSEARGFELLAVGRYTSSCLTQLRHIQISDGYLHFLTAATDGNVTLWKGHISNSRVISSQSPSKHVVQSTKKIHQSSIKSLDMMIGFSNFVVATGGDDNALALSVYSLTCLQEPQLGPKIFILRSAHAAAITALSIVPEEKKSDVRIITSGNDQRVKGWQVDVDLGTESVPDREEQLDISQLEDVFTSVADVGDLSVLGGGEGGAAKVLVVGNGMDIWEIPGKANSPSS